MAINLSACPFLCLHQATQDWQSDHFLRRVRLTQRFCLAGVGFGSAKEYEDENVLWTPKVSQDDYLKLPARLTSKRAVFNELILIFISSVFRAIPP